MGIFSFTLPAKQYRNVFENQPLTPLSSDNNLISSLVCQFVTTTYF